MKTDLIRGAVLLAVWLVLPTSPADARTFDAVTLISPAEEERGRFGFSVAGAGDVDGDGTPDLIVGAIGEDQGTSPPDAGRVYIFSGADNHLLFELVSPHEEPFGDFGLSVAGAGDLNQDGHADVIVGTIFEDPGNSPDDAGRAYVFSGKDGSLLFELISPHEEMDGLFGWQVASAGDVNQDGSADVIVGAIQESPNNSPPNAGRAYVFSGKDGSLLLELVSRHEESFGHFGYSVAGVGDVDQDGHSDVVVGSDESPGTSPAFAGRAYVISGLDGSLIYELSSPNEEASGAFGQSVSAAGDLNHDSVPDVIVGAWNEDPGNSLNGAGRAYAFSGLDGSLLFELVSPNDQEGGQFGYSVAAAGDVDQDGFGDVVVGAPSESPLPSPLFAGRAYIFSGRDGSAHFELVSPNDEFIGQFGGEVAGVGDVNHDGFPDVIVGAGFEDPGASPEDAGRAYLFLTAAGTSRINSGGPAYTDTGGRLFAADQKDTGSGFGYDGGRERNLNHPIDGTSDDALYEGIRLAREFERDGTFSYRFDVAAGSVEVTLYLTAPQSEAGGPVMDVRAEGQTVLDDLDVVAEAGGPYSALTKTFSVDVTDGRLDLDFVAVQRASVVSAIAVVEH